MLRGCIDLKFKGHFFSNPVFDKTIQRETFRDKYSISQDLQPFFYLIPSPSVPWSPESIILMTCKAVDAVAVGYLDCLGVAGDPCNTRSSTRSQ